MRNARPESANPSPGLASPALSALGDPTRGAIVSLLLDEPARAATVGQLTAALSLRQPTVSHHLKVLTAARVVDREPRGREVWYSLPENIVARIEEWLEPTAPAVVSGALLSKIIDDLSVRFQGTFSRETIERVALESYDLLRERGGGGGGRSLPSLTAQFASERLVAQRLSAQRANVQRLKPQRLHDGLLNDVLVNDGLLNDRHADGVELMASARPVDVLFVCVQNAGRSQLAAAIMRHLGGDRVRVSTAGSAPIDAIRPVVITALDEIGVPLGNEYPKPLTDEAVRAADVIVTMGCGDACPVYPGRRYLDWKVSDPAGQPLDRVRVIRDDIDARVRALLGELAS